MGQRKISKWFQFFKQYNIFYNCALSWGFQVSPEFHIMAEQFTFFPYIYQFFHAAICVIVVQLAWFYLNVCLGAIYWKRNILYLPECFSMNFLSFCYYLVKKIGIHHLCTYSLCEAKVYFSLQEKTFVRSDEWQHLLW